MLRIRIICPCILALSHCTSEYKSQVGKQFSQGRTEGAQWVTSHFINMSYFLVNILKLHWQPIIKTVNHVRDLACYNERKPKAEWSREEINTQSTHDSILLCQKASDQGWTLLCYFMKLKIFLIFRQFRFIVVAEHSETWAFIRYVKAKVLWKHEWAECLWFWTMGAQITMEMHNPFNPS